MNPDTLQYKCWVYPPGSEAILQQEMWDSSAARLDLPIECSKFTLPETRWYSNRNWNDIETCFSSAISLGLDNCLIPTLGKIHPSKLHVLDKDDLRSNGFIVQDEFNQETRRDDTRIFWSKSAMNTEIVEELNITPGSPRDVRFYMRWLVSQHSPIELNSWGMFFRLKLKIGFNPVASYTVFHNPVLGIDGGYSVTAWRDSFTGAVLIDSKRPKTQLPKFTPQ